MRQLSSLVAIGALVSFSADAAPDVVSVAPEHCKVLKEDVKVRVIDFTAKAGDKLPMHTHPAHVVYLIKAGKTQFTLEDGSKPAR